MENENKGDFNKGRLIRGDQRKLKEITTDSNWKKMNDSVVTNLDLGLADQVLSSVDLGYSDKIVRGQVTIQ